MTNIFVHDLTVNSAGRWFLVAVAAMFGGSFGSFMNVVVYRLPRGMNLSRPRSRCPACGRPIRWHDNVPILGWIRLGGRCRDCRAAFSPRYPLVETIVAAISGWLAWQASAVRVAGPIVQGGDFYQVDIPWWACHLLLLCTLVTAALIEWDGEVPPLRLIAVPLGLGLAMLLAWPWLLPPSRWAHAGGLWASGSGMSVAALMGAAAWLAWFVCAERSRCAHASASLAELVLVGGFLGDYAAANIGVASMALNLAAQFFARKWPAARRFGWAGCLTAITLSWVLAPPRSLALDPEGSAGSAMGLWAAVAVMAALGNVLVLASPPRRDTQRS